MRGIARTHRLIPDAEAIDRPGRNDSTNTSAVSQSVSRVSRCALSLRSSTTLFLPRLRLRKKTVLGPSESPICRPGSPSPGGFDLDDLGAVIGHREGQIGTRQEHREVDDADALELHEEPAGSVERTLPT